MSSRIYIPTHSAHNFGYAILNVLKLAKGIEYKLNGTDSVIIDFSKCSFLTPYTIATLAAYFSNPEKAGVLKIDSETTNGDLKPYLDLIHFYVGLQPEAFTENELKDTIKKYGAKTYIPLVSYNTKLNKEIALRRDNAVSIIHTLIANQLNLQPSYKSAISYLIDEMIDNVVQHAVVDRGILHAQFYPNLGFLDICIADMGRGVLAGYQENDYEYKTHLQAVKAALKGISTKKGETERGFGIRTSTRMLTQGLKGSLFLMSGNGLFINTSEYSKLVEAKKHYWQGTLVGIRIPLNFEGNFNYVSYLE